MALSAWRFCLVGVGVAAGVYHHCGGGQAQASGLHSYASTPTNSATTPGSQPAPRLKRQQCEPGGPTRGSAHHQVGSVSRPTPPWLSNVSVKSNGAIFIAFPYVNAGASTGGHRPPPPPSPPFHPPTDIWPLERRRPRLARQRSTGGVTSAPLGGVGTSQLYSRPGGMDGGTPALSPGGPARTTATSAEMGDDGGRG